MGKRGPAIGSGQKGKPTAIRFAPELKARLEAAAAAAGRNFTEEVTVRLEHSLTGGDETRQTWALLIPVATAITRLEALTGRLWHTDRQTAEWTKDTMAAVVDRFIPEGPRQVPPEFPTFVPPVLSPEVAPQLIKHGVGKICADEAVEIMFRPVQEANPLSIQTQQEREAARVLRKFFRAAGPPFRVVARRARISAKALEREAKRPLGPREAAALTEYEAAKTARKRKPE